MKLITLVLVALLVVSCESEKEKTLRLKTDVEFKAVKALYDSSSATYRKWSKVSDSLWNRYNELDKQSKN